MAEARDRLRTIFDEAVSLYDEVRPGYPEDLFDDVISLSGIPAGGRILEIGCGTGQATVPVAKRN
jgi:ubiquinone/menaquinone biosynthesis C-methylase UbiE